MNVRYRVELSQIERDELTAMLGGGKHAARKLKRAQILLAAEAGSSDEEIARTVSVSLSTVGRIKDQGRFGASSAASSSTTPRNMPVGSTWSSARSACYSASVLAAASTTPKGSETKSQHGKGGEIKLEPASNGCSPPTKLAPNSAAPIQPPPKGQNQGDEPLVSFALTVDPLRSLRMGASRRVSLPQIPLLNDADANSARFANATQNF